MEADKRPRDKYGLRHQPKAIEDFLLIHTRQNEEILIELRSFNKKKRSTVSVHRVLGVFF